MKLPRVDLRDVVEELWDAARCGDRAERTLRVAAAIADALARFGDTVVLVGGGAVELYTRSAYTTRDLDFVAPTTATLQACMMQLGFKKQGRHWIHEDLALAVEFPGSSLGPARSTVIQVGDTALRVISVEDLIVDRLASWKHWGWDPDGAAAMLLLALHEDLDQAHLDRRATTEEVADALEALRVRAASGHQLERQELGQMRARLQSGKRSKDDGRRRHR